MLCYTHGLFQELNYFDTLRQCSRVLQQFVVDQYCDFDAQRLKYILKSQRTARAEDYITVQ